MWDWSEDGSPPPVTTDPPPPPYTKPVIVEAELPSIAEETVLPAALEAKTAMSLPQEEEQLPKMCTKVSVSSTTTSLSSSSVETSSVSSTSTTSSSDEEEQEEGGGMPMEVTSPPHSLDMEMQPKRNLARVSESSSSSKVNCQDGLYFWGATTQSSLKPTLE